jgi:hypothetical protein
MQEAEVVAALEALEALVAAVLEMVRVLDQVHLQLDMDLVEVVLGLDLLEELVDQEVPV